ncbi:uncharacterized protein [Haliotis asinina]|uniref:uncharacterized protein n=1 Tax=Haliotis asinina TaxID=109174 RepID=UPI003531AF36
MIEIETTNEDGERAKSDVPMAYVKDLPKFVTGLLNNYHDSGQLTWHSQHIPEDEIWLKIGGDHGGGSLKLSLQIANLSRPNSKHNTVIFNIFEAKDTRKNLEIALSPYCEQFKQLNGQTWHGKHLRIFLFGDYDFLSKVYGISGAAAKFPCLWCHASKFQIQKDPESREYVEGRTLKTLKRDHRQFVEKGQGKIENAGAYHNAIHQPLFPVHINRVCPPYLHILLGVVKKHHVMLERECHELDLLIGGHALMTEEESPDAEFGEYILRSREIQKREKKEKKLSTLLEEMEDNTPLAHLELQENKLQETLKKLRKNISRKTQENKLKERKGPVTSNLDKLLNSHKIVPQAYHARSFVGNHCKKYLEPQVYEDLCRSITTIACKMTKHDGTLLRAYWIRDVYEELNRKFSVVHKLISHDKPIGREEIPTIQKKIKEYMSFYRRKFPSSSVTPKMHFLEDHVCDWINTWGFGLGLHGEQGGEQVHATINLLKRRVWGVKSDKMKYEIMLKEHHMQISPCVQSVLPVPTKRVKNS